MDIVFVIFCRHFEVHSGEGVQKCFEYRIRESAFGASLLVAHKFSLEWLQGVLEMDLTYR